MGVSVDQQQIGKTARHTRTDDVTSRTGAGVSADSSSRSKAVTRILTGKRIVLGVLVVAVLGILFLGFRSGMGSLGTPDQPLIHYTVTRGDLPIMVTERGNLESQDSIDVFCDVEDIHGDGVHGTTILWIVPNGSSIKKDELLVELDVSGHQDRLDKKILDVEKAREAKIKAKVKYENRITQNETLEADARLSVELAKLELDMFEDKEKGTHRLDVEEIKRLIEDIDNKILAAQADLELKKNDLQGVEQLFKLGYAGKNDLEKSRLDFLKAEGTYALEINKLDTQLSTLKKKEDYEQRMQLLTLNGAVKTAERKLQQILRDNEAELQQALAAMEAADEAFKTENELLERYGEAVKNCEIKSPADGMVAYAELESRYSTPIREGSAVRPRQKIITLPNLQRMQVKTAVHESVLDRVRCDLPASIRVDAFPEMNYRGAVKSVAVLPDRGGWASPDTKTYATVVTIDEEVEQLKPGMSAVVEIHVDRLKDVLTIPVQAVVQIERDTWCYVDVDGRTERRMIELGRTNDKFIEIRSGLTEGDQVVLNPMALLDESDKKDAEEAADDEGPEAADDESAEEQPAAARNVSAETPPAARDDASPSDQMTTRPNSPKEGRRRPEGERPRKPGGPAGSGGTGNRAGGGRRP